MEYMCTLYMYAINYCHSIIIQRSRGLCRGAEATTHVAGDGDAGLLLLLLLQKRARDACDGVGRVLGARKPSEKPSLHAMASQHHSQTSYRSSPSDQTSNCSCSCCS